MRLYGIFGKVARPPSWENQSVCNDESLYCPNKNNATLTLLVDIKGVLSHGGFAAVAYTVSVWNGLSYTGVPRLSSSRLFAPCLAVLQPSLTGSEQRTHLATELASIKHQRRNFTKIHTAVNSSVCISPVLC